VSLYSTSIVYMCAVSLNIKNVGQIVHKFIKTDAICFKPEERIYLYKRYLILHAVELVALFIIQAYFFVKTFSL
jgi:hypothetical protein